MYFPEFLEVPGSKVTRQRSCIPKPRGLDHHIRDKWNRNVRCSAVPIRLSRRWQVPESLGIHAFPSFPGRAGPELARQLSCIANPRILGHNLPDSEIGMLDVLLF